MNIFTKFHKDWTIIVDFLLIAKFLAIPDNYESPYTIVFPWKLSSVYVFLKSTNFLNRYITDMWKHIISTYDKKRDFWNNFASMYLKKECMLRTIVGLIAKRRCKKWISIIIKSDVRESFFFSPCQNTGGDFKQWNVSTMYQQYAKFRTKMRPFFNLCNCCYLSRYTYLPIYIHSC